MQASPNRVSVIGLGKLGSPVAAALASKGFEVIGADLSSTTVENINNGVAPIFEPGLQELLEKTEGRLTATTDVRAAVAGTEVSLVIVPTPSDADGFSLRFLLSACDDIGAAIAAKDDYHLVVITSTVLPGATGGPIRERLERVSGKRAGVDFGLCYSPEFIALGSVINDFLNPGFLLIGELDERSGDILESVYRRATENHPQSARCNLVNAELSKLAVNTFVTTKISFANMLARICERLPDADVDIVTGALGLDPRIGAKYLRGGMSYGGPCFPRDNIALTTFADSLGVNADLAETTDRFNRAQILLLADMITDRLPSGGTVGVLGLTYKAHSDVIEEAPGLLLLQHLNARGVRTVAFDPAANEKALAVTGVSHLLAASAVECVAQADAVAVTTAWPQFGDIPSACWGRTGDSRIVLDCWRSLAHLAATSGVTYLTLGVGKRP